MGERWMRAAGVALNSAGFLLGAFAAYALLTFQYMLWLWLVAAACAWLGAGFIYADARRYAATTKARDLTRFASYAITAAGVLAILYAGACSFGTLLLMVIAQPPQGNPLTALMLGLGAIVPSCIIAASLFFTGSSLRERGGTQAGG